MRRELGRRPLPITQQQAREKTRGLVDRLRRMSEGLRRGITETRMVHQFRDPLLQAIG